MSDRMLDYASAGFAAQVCMVATITWLAYDTAITIDEEVEYIWKSKWSIPKGLYLVSRYFAIIANASNLSISFTAGRTQIAALCYAGVWMYTASNVVVSATTHGILVLRLSALYNKRIITILLFILLGVQILFDLVTNIYFNHNGITTLAFINSGQRNTCFEAVTHQALLPNLALSISSLIVGAILFGMMIYRIRTSFTMGFPSRLTPTFCRDGTVSFAAMFAIALVTLVLGLMETVNGRGFLSLVGARFIMPVFSISACRMMLNLRSIGEADGVGSFFTSVHFAGERHDGATTLALGTMP